MNKTLWQQLTPHAVAIGIFFLVAVFYCLPAFQGMVVNSHDVASWKAMAQQSFEFKEKYGHFPLWTNSMFSGMPAFQIALESKYNITIAHLHHLFTLFLPIPASLFFLACIGVYILCCTIKLRSWVGVFAGLAYAFSTYNATLVSAGHVSKLASMGYTPALIAGLILLTQRKYVLGFATTMVFGTLLLYQNHIQVVYYTLLTLLIFGIAYAIYAFKAKDTVHLLKIAGLAAIAGLICFGQYTVMLLPLNDYAKETMRGGRSELTDTTSKNNQTKGGLDKEYAFRYSYGIGETLTFILPAYKGGSSGPMELGETGKTVEALQESQLPQQAVNMVYGDLSSYWGDQPPTSGPFYLGVIVCLLFIAGLFLVRSWHMWWLIPVAVFGLILGWGGNLAGINYFLFDHMPLYNKFRAPSIALIMPQLAFTIVAAMALNHLLFEEWDRKIVVSRLKYAGIISGVIAAILIFTYVSADFRSKTDTQVKQNIASIVQMVNQGNANADQVQQQATAVSNSIVGGVVSDRKALYASDLLRTLVFMVLAALVVYLIVQKKIRPLYAALALIILTLADLLPVDQRYLNKQNYVPKDEFETVYTPTPADLQIKQDTGYYRVFENTGRSPFDNPRTAYFHNSVLGYHPAKLALYDDLISHQIAKGNMQVLNMLNAKYFIFSNQQDGQPVAQRNPDALGPAWLVKTIRYVNNANEEMAALDNFSPADTAIADKREQSKIPFNPQYDSSAYIRLVYNRNDEILYDFSAGSKQFAVFSEVYYPRGWKAFIDGKETPIAKVNYVLRGLAVPAGKHKIEFRFEPASVSLGDTISLIIGIISILLLAGTIWYEWRSYKRSAAPPRKA
jgi:hypothetical protein